MTYKILVADDEMELLSVLELYMAKENLTLIKACDGNQAWELFLEESPHLVVLDVMMPGMDGFTVLRKIRNISKIPAIMLTARSEDYDKILGLELGADDYITKPYNPMEVIARIKAQIRRNYDYQETHEEIYKQFDLELYVEEGIVKKQGETIELTKTEFLILKLLMEKPGRIYTKQQIYDCAWGEEYIADDNMLMVHISNLRAKIEDNPRMPQMLKTVKGLGYKFEKDDKKI
jgi:DNA-binding response OmpR family regulator